MQESNYDILGISEIASKKEIHEAFRRLALLHHADRGGNEEEFKKIKQSYDDIKQGKKYPDNNAEKKHKSHVYSTDDEEETRRRNAILAKEISEQMKLAKEWSDALSRANITGRHLFGSKVLGEMEFERTANGVMSIKGNIMAGSFIIRRLKGKLINANVVVYVCHSSIRRQQYYLTLVNRCASDAPCALKYVPLWAQTF